VQEGKCKKRGASKRVKRAWYKAEEAGKGCKIESGKDWGARKLVNTGKLA
jgi:hypothetical protein